MRGSICNVTPAIILSPHCTLRYDAGCPSYAPFTLRAMKVVFSDAPLLPASNDGAYFLPTKF